MHKSNHFQCLPQMGHKVDWGSIDYYSLMLVQILNQILTAYKEAVSCGRASLDVAKSPTEDSYPKVRVSLLV
jgi:hypothetical protein